MAGINLLNNITPIPKQEELPADCIVLGEKVMNSKAMHMLVARGGNIPLGDMFGIRMFHRNNDFMAIQLISKGIANPIRYSVQPRAKVIIKKEKEPKKEKSLIEYNQTEENLI